jgi:hypothetical protein
MDENEKSRLLAVRVMGWVTPGCIPAEFSKTPDFPWDPVNDWAPFSNLSHAGEVLEAMAKRGWSARMAMNSLAANQNGCEFFMAALGLGQDIFSAGYDGYGPDKRVWAVRETLPAAICDAALLAIGVGRMEGGKDVQA